MRTSGEDQERCILIQQQGLVGISQTALLMQAFIRFGCFDLNGKMVMEMETGWLEAGIPASVDISHLSAGTYT